MAPAGFAQHAAAAGAQDEAFLDQEGLDHVFEGVAGLGQGGGQGFDADGAAVVVLGNAAEVAAVHGVEPEGIDLEPGQRRVGDQAVDGAVPGHGGEVAHAAQQAAGDAGGAAGAAGDLYGAFVGEGEAEFFRAAGDDAAEFFGGVEDQAERDAEAVAQRGGEQAGAGGGADEGEGSQVDADAAGGGALADDEVELEVLHGGVEDFLDGGLEAVDLIDEQHVAGLQVGQDGGEVSGALDDGARGGAEADAELAGDDLGEGGLAEAGGAVEEDVVESLATGAGGLDEDAEVFAGGALADELVEGLGAEGGLGGVFLGTAGGDGAVTHGRGAVEKGHVESRSEGRGRRGHGAGGRGFPGDLV